MFPQRFVQIAAAATLLAAVLGAMAQADDGDPAGLNTASIRVIDGDSFAVGAVRYRLHGWDAPEARRPRCNGLSCKRWCIGERRKGEAATAALRALLDGAGAVRIAPVDGRDIYSRHLAILLIDGRDAGALLAARGLAKPSLDGARADWCTFNHGRN